jgi:hypothetical protein
MTNTQTYTYDVAHALVRAVSRLVSTPCVPILAIGALLALSAGAIRAADVLPKPDSAFKGKIDPSRDKSSPDWPQRPSAPRKGAPNVVLILLDDVGFGAISTFGGPWRHPAWTNWPRAACATTAFT